MSNGPTMEQLNGAVLALTREVEGLRRRLEIVHGQTEKAQTSADVATMGVKRISDAIAAGTARPSADAVDQGDDPESDEPEPVWWTVKPDDAPELVGRLCRWLGEVYVRYPGGQLPECWAWHPWVIAELDALRLAWVAAHSAEATAAARVDWHDRYRPGVVERIHRALASCKLSEHAPTGRRAEPEPRLQGDEMVGALTAWWIETRGTTVAPVPSPDMLAASTARRAADRAQAY